MSGIGKAIAAYQKLQMDMIGKLSVGSESILEETPFYDEGYIYTQIERLKREHEDVSRDLKIATELDIQSEYEQQKKVQLKARLDKIEVRMMYYAINSIHSLELCKMLVKGKNIKIAGLIEALDYYQKGNFVEAEREFARYFADNSVDTALFLGNKIYGKILLKNGSIEAALVHLEHAVQLKVDDKELLMMLQNIYQTTNRELEQRMVNEVCQILG